MALGVGLMFGRTRPDNFHTPYTACSFRDFWRRWHMTLSRFLRDYLYVPLGGNREGLARLITALFVTMLLGGLWHGAAWTFVVWGGLHGLALVLEYLWRRTGLALPAAAGWAATMLFVFVTWVLFRAETFGAAIHILSAMAGGNGWAPRVAGAVGVGRSAGAAPGGGGSWRGWAARAGRGSSAARCTGASRACSGSPSRWRPSPRCCFSTSRSRA